MAEAWQQGQKDALLAIGGNPEGPAAAVNLGVLRALEQFVKAALKAERPWGVSAGLSGPTH